MRAILATSILFYDNGVLVAFVLTIASKKKKLEQLLEYLVLLYTTDHDRKIECTQQTSSIIERYYHKVHSRILNHDFDYDVDADTLKWSYKLVVGVK